MHRFERSSSRYPLRCSVRARNVLNPGYYPFDRYSGLLNRIVVVSPSPPSLHSRTVVEVCRIVRSLCHLYRCRVVICLLTYSSCTISLFVNPSYFLLLEQCSTRTLILCSFLGSSDTTRCLDISIGLSNHLVTTRDRKSTRLNSSHSGESRMPSSA